MAGIYQRYILRSDSEANWITKNPKLALNELIYVTDPSIANFKVGDGINTFSNLSYLGADKHPFRGVFPVGTLTNVHKNEVWEDSLSGTPYVALQDFTTSDNPVTSAQWAIFWYVTQDQLAPFAQNRVSRIVQDKATGLWNRTYYSRVKAAFGGPGSAVPPLPAIPPGSVVVAAAPAGDEIRGNYEQVNIANGCIFNTGGYNLGDPFGYTRPDGTAVPFTEGDVITVNGGKTTIIGLNATVYVNATGNWGLGMYGSPTDLDLVVNNLNFESRNINVCFKINAGKAVHTGNITVLGGGSGLSSGGTSTFKSTGDIYVESGRAFRAFNSSSLTHYGNSRVMKGNQSGSIIDPLATITVVGGVLDYKEYIGSPFAMAGTLILQDVTVIDNGGHIGAPRSSTSTAKIYLRGETVYNVTATVPTGLTIIDERVATSGGTVKSVNTILPNAQGDVTISAEPITYATLAQRIGATGLVAGKWYLLTDYQTVHTIPNPAGTNIATVEPLYILAATNKSLAAEAYSASHPEDVIYYNPTNDEGVLPGCTKGYISRRIDTKFNNDFPFDFRGILVRRWMDATGEYTMSYYDGNGTVDDFTEGLMFNNTQYQSSAYTNNKWERQYNAPIFDAFNVFFGSDTYCLSTTVEIGSTLNGVTVLSGAYLYSVKLGGHNNSFTNVAILGSSYISGLDLSEGSSLYSIHLANYSSLDKMEVKKSSLGNIRLNIGYFYDCYLTDGTTVDNIAITDGSAVNGLYMQTSNLTNKDLSGYGINLVRMVDCYFGVSTIFTTGHGIDNSMFYDCDSDLVFGANDFSHKFYHKNKEVGSGGLTETDTIDNYRTRFNTNGEIPEPGMTYIVTGRTSFSAVPAIYDGPLDAGDGTINNFYGVAQWQFVENSPGGSYSLSLTTYGSYYGQQGVETTAGAYAGHANDYRPQVINTNVPRGTTVSYVLIDYVGSRILWHLTAPANSGIQAEPDVYGEFHMASGDDYTAFMNVATVGDYEGAYTYNLLTDTLKPLGSNIVIEQNLNSNSQTSVPSVYAVVSGLSSKAPIDSPNFTGLPTAPTPYQTDNSDQISTTSFVQTLFGVNTTVYRSGILPERYEAYWGVYNGNTITHDFIELRGMIGNLWLKGQDWTVNGHNAVVQSVWTGAEDAGRKITVNGFRSTGSWFIHESTDDATGIGHDIRVNYCTIPVLVSFQVRNGGYRDKHTFTHCKIGYVSRAAAYNGMSGHAVNFDQCVFGEGVTSGYLVGDYQSGEMRARFNNCIFRLSGTAQVGPPNPVVSYYPNLQFHNCTVVNSDGTSYRLDNAGVIAHRTGTVVKFENDAEYDPIYSGTFTIDATVKTVGAVVTIYLGPSATEPTIPTTGFKKVSGAYAAGSNLMYMFKVGANNQIQYTINNVD